MNLEDTITETMAKQLQEEIDWELMCDVMKTLGWTMITISKPWSEITLMFAKEVKDWCSENLKGHYRSRGRTWLFEKEKDAVLFSLKWS